VAILHAKKGGLRAENRLFRSGFLLNSTGFPGPTPRSKRVW